MHPQRAASICSMHDRDVSPSTLMHCHGSLPTPQKSKKKRTGNHAGPHGNLATAPWEYVHPPGRTPKMTCIPHPNYPGRWSMSRLVRSLVSTWGHPRPYDLSYEHHMYTAVCKWTACCCMSMVLAIVRMKFRMAGEPAICRKSAIQLCDFNSCTFPNSYLLLFPAPAWPYYFHAL